MNINSNLISSTFVNGGPAQNMARQSDGQSSLFASMLTEFCEAHPEYTGAAARNALSEREITALAYQYDVRNLSGSDYKALLDDLEKLGAITASDKTIMQGFNLVCTHDGPECNIMNSSFAGTALDGLLSHGDQLSAAKGNLLQLLKAGTKRPNSREQFDLLSGIISRMDECRSNLETTDAPETNILEQAANPDSGFWLNIQNAILETAKKNKEIREEEEKIQLLGAIVDNAVGKNNDPRVSAAVGLRLGMNADQEIFAAGSIPPELQLYMMTLGNRAAIETVEDPEERNQEKVQQVDAAGIEKLYTSAKRHGLTDGQLADLAKKYDPNNMSQAEYDRFLEELVELGAVSKSAVERIGYHGVTADRSDNALYIYSGPPVSDTPILNRSPIDNDIEGWIQNRLLWKPGITRESAKRDGFTADYNRIAEEQETLSTIAEILADVKRQRYPGVSL